MWLPGIVADVGPQDSQGWSWWGDAGLADCLAGAPLGGSYLLHHRVGCTVILQVVGQISCKQEIGQTSTQAREGVFLVPWHLAKRARVAKRAPAADPGGVSLSVTANMDTLRNRLL